MRKKEEKRWIERLAPDGDGEQHTGKSRLLNSHPMIFCPYCANQLGLVEGPSGNKWGCATCPYEFPLEKRYVERTYLKRKEVDDVLGGEDSWKNVDSTAVDCPKECGSDRAFFMQIQIRSADEPSTTFYKCCNMECNHQWREN